MPPSLTLMPISRISQITGPQLTAVQAYMTSIVKLMLPPLCRIFTREEIPVPAMQSCGGRN